MRNEKPVYDGDVGPIRRFTLKEDGLPIDQSACAVEVYTFTEAGVQIGRRVARPVSPKATSGKIDLSFAAIDTDRDGIGGAVILKARVYFAMTNAGDAAAANVLLNPSFDTGSAVADSWTQNGTLGPMVYEVGDDDPWPATVFGKRQRSFVPTGGGTTAYIAQAQAATIVPGDVVAGGVWVRSYATPGASVAGGEHYVEIMSSRPEQAQVVIPAGDDWRFLTVAALARNSYGTLGLELVNLDMLGYEVRYDDAFAFVGFWRVVHSKPLRIPIEGRGIVPRKPVTSPFPSAGWGGLDVDSDGDGVADGLSKTGSTNTYAHETDPDHLNIGYNPNGFGAQKVTLNSATTDRLRFIYRVKVLPGESWDVRVAYKNSGALAGAPAAGDFGVMIHSEEFDGIFETTSTTGANFLTSSVAAYTTKFRTIVFTAAHSAIVIDINLRGVSGGSLWLDDLEVFLVSP